MLSQTTLNLAYTLAKEVGSSKRPLYVYNSPFGELSSKIDRKKVLNKAVGEYNDDVTARGIYEALESTEDTERYGIMMDRMVTTYRGIITNILSYLRNTVVPIVKETSETITKQLDALDPGFNVVNEYDIKTYPDINFLEYDEINDGYARYLDTKMKVHVADLPTIKFTELSEELLLTFITENTADYTKETILKWYHEVSGNFKHHSDLPLIEFFWKSIYTRTLKLPILRLEKIRELPLHERVVFSVLNFLLTRQFKGSLREYIDHHNPSWSTDTLLSVYHITAVHELAHAKHLYKKEESRGNIVYHYDKVGKVLNVAKHAYANWLESHSREDLISVATLSKKRSVSGLASEIDESRKSWENYITIENIRYRNRKLELLKELIKSEVGSLITSDRWVDCVEENVEAHRKEANRRLQESIACIAPNDIDDIPVLVEQTITQCVFFTTHASELLTKMRLMSDKTELPREAASLATIEYLVNHFASTITRK